MVLFSQISRVRPCKNFHFNLCPFIAMKTSENHEIKPLRISAPSPKSQKISVRENYGVYSCRSCINEEWNL